jgi:Flp pilus assembly protein TadG
MAGKRGTALLEFGLMLPLILVLVAGVLDYSLLMCMAISVADAARVGAQYGSLSAANASNTTGMQNAALNAAPDVPGLTATASKVCKCSDGTTVNCSGGSCSSGPVRVYAQVKASTTSAPIINYSPLSFTGVISTTASMRAQ